MATKKTTPQAYGDQSIQQLKGADRVRKRPAVIFGSDGLDGCEQAFFEILSVYNTKGTNLSLSIKSSFVDLSTIFLLGQKNC